MSDGIRLGIGTFTRYPVAPPAVVGHGPARVAVLSAPLWGLLAALPGAAAAVLLWWGASGAGNASPLTALLAGLVALAGCAWFTRGLHLDGLADLADGLGSRRGRDHSLEVMREPGVGAFGVIALVLVLGLQAAALGAAFSQGQGVIALAGAVVLSRAALGFLTTRGTPARDDGLGAGVVGVTSLTSAGLVFAGYALLFTGLVAASGGPWLVSVAAMLVALASALAVRQLAVRRLGVVTGDVLGAAVELATTGVLVTWAVLG